MEATEKSVFLGMLSRLGIGHGIRYDRNPPGTSVMVEHAENMDSGDDAYYVTEWLFNDDGVLVSTDFYRGEPI